ncbi:MAG: putative bifunctional diguanylate cyclase/phosphodiesterase [Geminicoccaceae bacterium]
MIPTPGQGSGGQTLLQRYAAMLANRRADDYAHIALDQKEKLQRLDLLMRNIVEQSFDGIIAFDEQGFVRTANEAACQIFRGSQKEIIGQHLKRLLPDFNSFRRSAHASPEDLNGHSSRLEGLAYRLDKTTCPIELALRKISIGRENWLMAILRDITVVKAHEHKLRHLALHDTLTDLPNRHLLKDRLDQMLDVARRTREPITLAILDLDRFKEVNDTLGHQVGDALLIDVAKRLAGCVRRCDTVARLGGDEFAILMPQLNGVCSAHDVAKRIVEAIHQPFSIAGCIALEVGVSIGLAMFPNDADSESKLMQCADIAMYDAKRNATSIERYDPAKDINSIRTLVLSGGLRQAMEGDQLSLVLQPKLDLPSGEIRSFEVLTRWRHPDHGQIPPDEFVPQAEQSGNIIPFTRWTLERTLECLTTWQGADFDLSLALNLSPRSLHSKEILSFMEELLVSSKISPAQLTLELTETAVMLDPEGALVSLRKLHDLGLRLSIDDFGTGYSSLSLLRQLPLSEIKIDKSFIENMIASPQDQVIVASTISLAHNLGLEVVAEGVETKAQMAALEGLECDVIQGFLIAEPIAYDDLAAWAEQAPWPLRKLRSAA